MSTTSEDDVIYTVVTNAQDQYSIWPVDRVMPFGWKAAGKTGIRSECLDFIADFWVDMRPLSLQKEMNDRVSTASTPRGSVKRQ